MELAVLIGTAGRNIPKANAMSHAFGYTILNDIIAFAIQRRLRGQNIKGKGLDGSCPLGPVIVTGDNIDDPHVLGFRPCDGFAAIPQGRRHCDLRNFRNRRAQQH